MDARFHQDVHAGDVLCWPTSLGWMMGPWWLMGLTGFRAPVIEYCGGTEIGGGYATGTVPLPASPACFSTPALGLDLAILDESGRPADEGEVFLTPPSIGLSQELLNAEHHEVYFADCPAGPAGEVLRRHGDRMEQLADRLRREVNPLFRIHEVRLVDRLPRTASNKLVRRELRERYHREPT